MQGQSRIRGGQEPKTSCYVSLLLQPIPIQQRSNVHSPRAVWTCTHGRQHDNSCCPDRYGNGFAFWRPGVPAWPERKDDGGSSKGIQPDIHDASGHGVSGHEVNGYEVNGKGILLQEPRRHLRPNFPFEAQAGDIILEMSNTLKLTEHEFFQLQHDLWFNYLRTFDLMKVAFEQDRLKLFINPAILSTLERLIRKRSTGVTQTETRDLESPRFGSISSKYVNALDLILWNIFKLIYRRLLE